MQEQSLQPYGYGGVPGGEIVYLGIGQGFGNHCHDGMLALAAWDRRTRTLWLARDRVGKKPLYYGWTGDGTFLFGSELAALRACPSLHAEVDQDALALLLRLDYIPAPHCILKGIRKLPAGALVRIDTAHTEARAMPDAHLWWDARARQEAAAGIPQCLRIETPAVVPAGVKGV